MLVSIITINYNNFEGLKKTYESVQALKGNDYELIIIDGLSTDGGSEFVLSLPQQDNLIVVSEKDNGIYNAMNKGVSLASGDYCIFMNSGDLFYDENVIENIKKDLITNQFDIVSGIAHINGQVWKSPEEKDLSLTFFLKRSLSHQATFIKRNLLIDDPYDENYKIVSDSLFFFKSLVLKGSSYLKSSVFVTSCEDPGLSGNYEATAEEMRLSILSNLPKRMNYDVDFILEYHNPAVLYIGKFLKKITILRTLLKFIRKNRRNR